MKEEGWFNRVLLETIVESFMDCWDWELIQKGVNNITRVFS